MALIPWPDAGMAGTDNESWTAAPELVSGDTPKISTIPGVVNATVIASVDLPAFSVVGYNASKELILATYNATPASAIDPVGITTARVLTGSTAKNVAFFTSGCFNPAALNWDSTWDTDAKKLHAFDRSTVCDIRMRAIPTYGA